LRDGSPRPAIIARRAAHGEQRRQLQTPRTDRKAIPQFPMFLPYPLDSPLARNYPIEGRVRAGIMNIMAVTDRHLAGIELYGEDLDESQITEWYAKEQTGYFELAKDHCKLTGEDGRYQYEYEALNRFHGFNALKGGHFDLCVALGCAAGDDVAPLAPLVGRFVGIEPAKKWWRDNIGGKPAVYLEPSVTGIIPLANESAQLATSIGVLHHIPNVSLVLQEIRRVLTPGGLFLVREPISWMGDWRKPRVGLTANERGLPIRWFEQTARATGFEIRRRRLCLFRPFELAARFAGMKFPYTNHSLVVADWLISSAMAWNVRYRRDKLSHKLAPGSAFWVLKRR
jgi:SAM-dependent methyltransferase